MQDQMWEASSYVIAIFGSVFLWVSYALFGLIARRYGQVFGRVTYHTLLILSPTGLLVYTLFLILKATPVLSDPVMAGAAQWIAYLCLLASGLFCLIGIARFSRILNSVTRPQADTQPVIGGRL